MHTSRHDTGRSTMEKAQAVTQTLHIAYSLQCNLSCDHCICRCGPGLDQALGVATAKTAIGEAREAGIQRIVFTGGEPLIRYREIRHLLRYAAARGLACAVITNASWAASPAQTWEILTDLKQAGLDSITLSTDRYHARHVPATHVIRAAEFARKAGLRVAVKIARLAHDPIAWGLYRAVAKHAQRILVQEISPLGRASLLRGAIRSMALPHLRHNGCRTPAVLLPDGGLLACCNLPARDLRPTDSPFIVGSVREGSLASLLARRRTDPLLTGLQRHGPACLLERLARRWPDLGTLKERTFHDACELCFYTLSHPLVREGGLKMARPVQDGHPAIDQAQGAGGPVIANPVVPARVAATRAWPEGPHVRDTGLDQGGLLP